METPSLVQVKLLEDDSTKRDKTKEQLLNAMELDFAGQRAFGIFFVRVQKELTYTVPFYLVATPKDQDDALLFASVTVLSPDGSLSSLEPITTQLTLEAAEDTFRTTLAQTIKRAGLKDKVSVVVPDSPDSPE